MTGILETIVIKALTYMYERGAFQGYSSERKDRQFWMLRTESWTGLLKYKRLQPGRKTTGASNSSAQDKVGVAVCDASFHALA